MTSERTWSRQGHRHLDDTGDMTPDNVGDLSEDALVAYITERTGTAPEGEVWAGDDTAVIAASGQRMLFAIDSMQQGVDFDLAWARGSDVGWKALAINLSDVAAMGGEPRRCVVSLTVPPSLERAWLDDFLEGLLAAARDWGVDVVGGDISSGSEVATSVSVLGSVDRPVLRSGAGVGDVIGVTGSLGGAAAGLEYLKRGSADLDPAVVERQLRPRPRILEGKALAQAGATAMIDVSDGFLLDLTRLTRASGVGFEIARDRVPVDPAIDDPDALRFALEGGEDFELVATIPADRWEAAVEGVRSVGGSLTGVGRTVASGLSLDGEPLRVEEVKGWDHLQNR